jgi:3-hydroxyacyl-[acyl-carrier-protein] dehydratase
MLKDSLYIIHKITAENNSIEAVVELKEDHEIFKGHFPSQPVLPGACMLQMIKEISETALTVKLQLIKADDIKFLQMIVPESNTVLLFSIQYNFEGNLLINVSAKIATADVICCKLKALYQVKTNASLLL